MSGNNFLIVQKEGVFSKLLIKIKSFFGKKQYDRKISKEEFFNIYDDLKNGDISIEELDAEMIEGLVKIANEEKKIKQIQLASLKKELANAKRQLIEIEALI